MPIKEKVKFKEVKGDLPIFTLIGKYEVKIPSKVSIIEKETARLDLEELMKEQTKERIERDVMTDALDVIRNKESNLRYILLPDYKWAVKVIELPYLLDEDEVLILIHPKKLAELLHKDTHLVYFRPKK